MPIAFFPVRVDKLQSPAFCPWMLVVACRHLQGPLIKGKRQIQFMDESMDLLNAEIARLLGADKSAVLRGLKKLNANSVFKRV